MSQAVLLYLDSANHGLVRRWLALHTDGRQVYLVFHRRHHKFAAEIREAFPGIAGSAVIPEEGLDCPEVAELRERLGLTRIVLPLAIKHKPVQFIEGAALPRLDLHYTLFRRLWKGGFREFELYNLGGVRVFRVDHWIDDLVGIHRGKRCFVVGNGPSLNQIDMTRLKDEITFGSNRCYLGFERWGYAFNYWACVDRLQLEEYGHEYEQNVPDETLKFLPIEYLPLLDLRNVAVFHQSFDARQVPEFTASPDVVGMGGTVTYNLIHIAILLGCNPVVLIGNDFNYPVDPAPPPAARGSRLTSVATRGLQRLGLRRGDTPAASKPVNTWTAGEAGQATHFDDRYTKDKRFIRWRPDYMRQAFSTQHEWASRNGVQIINATPGTRLDVFPKVDYNQLF